MISFLKLGGVKVRITEADYVRDYELFPDDAEWDEWVSHLLERNARQDDFEEGFEAETYTYFFGESKETQKIIADMLHSFHWHQDGLSRTQRQNLKRTMTTRIKNALDEDIPQEVGLDYNEKRDALEDYAYADYVRKEAPTKADMLVMLVSVCEHTSKKKIKKALSNLC